MELNIAKLKKQKLEQDLNKAVNRLNSLQNGGPVEETDAGTDADDLNSTTGSTNNFMERDLVMLNPVFIICFYRWRCSG